jgi:hypothetical protein
MTFDPVTGEGEKVFVVSVAKNDIEGVGNNFGPGAYIPDTQKLLELFSDILPEDFEITMEDVKVESYLPGASISNAVAITAVSPESVTVEWKKPADNEIGNVGGYIVDRYVKGAEEGDDKYVASGSTKINSSDTLTHTDTSLEAGKIYKYNVAAVVDADAEIPVIIVRLDGAAINPESGTASELDPEPIESNPARLGDFGSIDYSVSFIFSGIEDYNAKMKALITEEFWDQYNANQRVLFECQELEWTDILPATFEVEETDDETVYTFTEDARVTELFSYYLADICINDDTGAWVDVMGGSWDYAYSEVVTPIDGIFTLQMGDEVETFEYNAYDEFTMSVTVKNEITPTPEEPTQPAESSSTSSPDTGAGSLSGIALLSGISLIAILTGRKRR